MKKLFGLILVLMVLILSGCEVDTFASNAKIESIKVFNTSYEELAGEIVDEFFIYGDDYYFYDYINYNYLDTHDEVEKQPLNSVAPIDYFYSVDVEPGDSVIIRFEITINRKFDFHELKLNDQTITIEDAYAYEIDDKFLTLDVLYEDISIENAMIYVNALTVTRRSDSSILKGSTRLNNMIRFRGIFLNVSNRVAHELYEILFSFLATQLSAKSDIDFTHVTEILDVYSTYNRLFIVGLAKDELDDEYLFEIYFDLKDYYSDIIVENQMEIFELFNRVFNLQYNYIQIIIHEKSYPIDDAKAQLIASGAFETYITDNYNIETLSQHIIHTANPESFFIYGNYYVTYATKQSRYIYKVHQVTMDVNPLYDRADYVEAFMNFEDVSISIDRHRTLSPTLVEFVENINLLNQA